MKLTNRRRVWTLVSVSFLSGAAAAQDLTRPEFPVNVTTTGPQLKPAVAMQANGDFVVVWKVTGRLVARKFARDGEPLGDEITVTDEWTPSDPAIAMHPDGKFLVVWTRSARLFGQLFDAAAEKVGQELALLEGRNAREHDVSYLTADSYVVVWTDNDGSSSGIFARLFDAAGSELGDPIEVNSFTTGEQREARVAADAEGNFVVVWQSTNQAGGPRSIHGQSFSVAGTRRGGEFLVSSDPDDVKILPGVSMSSFGEFVVSWVSWPTSGGWYQVHARRFGSDGSPRGEELRVDSGGGYGVRPVVALRDSGDFFIAWVAADDDREGVFGRRFKSNGSPLGAPFRVNEVTYHRQTWVDADVTEDGDFVMAWTSALQDGESWGVYARQSVMPECAVRLSLDALDESNLEMGFSVASFSSQHWGVWLFAMGQVFSLWSVEIGAVEPSVSFSLTVPRAGVGDIAMVSTLYSDDDGYTCFDAAFLEAPGAGSEE